LRLLFLTQVLDAGDAVLGFVSRWVEGLAKECERVRVVALEVGDTGGLPGNIDWREVGRQGRVGRYLKYRGFLKEALQRDGYDAVLAHMVPRYALVAAGPAKRAGAGLFLWYTHAGVDARLRRAVRVVDTVFTATPESLRVETPNKLVTGHGVDLAHFDPRGHEPAVPPRLLSVGRMTPAKDPLTVLTALSILASRGRELALDWVGAGLTDSDTGFARTIAEHLELGGLSERVELLGAMPYREVPRAYRRATIVVNASLTGSLDKVVLEAMASGRCVVSCNPAATAVLAELERPGLSLSFEPGNAEQLADRIEALMGLEAAERAELGERARAIVARDHEVDALMARLVREMGGGAR
jgi:glycosyltransferase involved in cell wall biosynthesis